MFAEDLLGGDVRFIEPPLSVDDPSDWLKELAKNGRKNREVIIRESVRGRAFELVPPDGSGQPMPVQLDQDDADWLTADGQAVAAWVARLSDQGVGLQIHVLEAADLGNQLSVGIDDAVADQVRVASRRVTHGFGPIRDWLIDEFALPPAPGKTAPRYVHSGGPGDVHSGGPGATGNGNVRALTLHGRRWVADVNWAGDALRIVRLTDAASRQRAKWFRLSTVDIAFADRGEEAEANEAIRAALRGLSSDGRTYLELWQAYNQIEREALVEDAKRMRWGTYRECQITAEGVWRFDLQPGERSGAFLASVAAERGPLELEAAAALPPELQDGGPGRATSVHGEVREVSRANWTIDLKLDGDEVPPVTGHLFRSLSGDRVRLRRRDLARERIETDQAELPGLRLLIEGLPRPGARAHAEPRHDKAIAAATAAADGVPPTENQRAALQMALRTPDILLVQGPPGTGKTRFIADLLRCLDELGDRTVTMNRTLISSVQHDAVDNVARRARQRGLPPTRVSTKRERDRESVREWRDEVVGRIDDYLTEHRPDVARRDAVVKLRQLAAAYDSQPVTGTDLVAMLNVAKNLAGAALSGGLRDRFHRLLAARTVDDRATGALAGAEREQLARVVRSLRTTAVGFADDGPQRARYALGLLDALIDDCGRALLIWAAETDGDESVGTDGGREAKLAELADFRLNLLGRLTTDTAILNAPTHDPEVEALLFEIADAAEEAAGDTVDSADEVLRAYRDDLREDLDLVESTLARYNAVLAATVQQASSPQMVRLLDAPLPVFDTVVVDEAARANPLDLMIPMAFARKRIILVGDHKQLPHMLEQKVERELRRNRTLDGSELSMSLFERWFEVFAAEKPSVRTVLLDTQFRMHPVLGRFVSATFYGGPDVIKADPSTGSLLHGLAPYAGKVAAWVDVPHTDGPEERAGFSRTRPSEARRLVEELSRLAELDSDRRLSFGVITFYRAQQNVLEAELIRAGLGIETDEGSFQPVPTMAYTSERKPRSRLRIGTVDAFQGMEFDVVLLSVTRSSLAPRTADDPAEAVRRYGHLLSDSRMCVAMSRQRRLLIVVGDAAMADRSATPEAPGRKGRSVAEGIVAFRELCEGVHGAGVRP